MSTKLQYKGWAVRFNPDAHPMFCWEAEKGHVLIASPCQASLEVVIDHMEGIPDHEAYIKGMHDRSKFSLN